MMIRIMIVAAYLDVREGLSTVLNLASNLEVIGTAFDLESAIQQACDTSPDVILVDLEMPGDEGFETLRQIRRKLHHMKMIALTSHDYPSALEKALQAGANLVMVKGLDVSGMVDAIQTM